MGTASEMQVMAFPAGSRKGLPSWAAMALRYVGGYLLAVYVGVAGMPTIVALVLMAWKADSEFWGAQKFLLIAGLLAPFYGIGLFYLLVALPMTVIFTAACVYGGKFRRRPFILMGALNAILCLSITSCFVKNWQAFPACADTLRFYFFPHTLAAGALAGWVYWLVAIRPLRQPLVIQKQASA